MIKLFEQYNGYNQVKNWLDEMRVKNYTINDDLTVDVNGHVNLSEFRLTEIPIQFGRVTGIFYIDRNSLTSLKGCPNYVGSKLSCSHNKLTTLEYGPEYVGETFNCSNNKLTSLEYSPKFVGYMFFCHSNNLSGLKGFPDYINSENINLGNNGLPTQIYTFKDIKTLIKYQDDYGIWNQDGSFNKARWNIFNKDFKAGILK